MTSKTITAVVIDDDLDNVELFTEYLEMNGIEVLAKGYDGKQAVELYEERRPDVIFVDIVMPHYDGFYAIENIRKFDPDAKIIMATADLTSNTADQLDDLHVKTVVYKPYEFEEIMSTVLKLVE